MVLGSPEHGNAGTVVVVLCGAVTVVVVDAATVVEGAVTSVDEVVGAVVVVGRVVLVAVAIVVLVVLVVDVGAVWPGQRRGTGGLSSTITAAGETRLDCTTGRCAGSR
jgi:hypothetical protein